MSNQPTNEALKRAFGQAIDCEGIGGARALSRQELQTLRNARTTWCGADELKLRSALDAYLSGQEPSNDSSPDD